MLKIACVCAAVLAMTSPALADERYALVIGSNPGWSQDRPLRYAENDAERVRDVLVSLGGFAPERVTLLRDPSTADVRQSLRRLANLAQQHGADPTLVFVYYSGHADDLHLHLRGAPLAHKELQDTLRSMPATVRLGVVDACKSGAVTHKGGARADEFVVDVDAPRLSGMVLLSSSGADELSQESRALAGSVFTHHLVSGLRGAADEDDDKQVTIGEAYHYAYSRTRATTASGVVQQRPAFRYELTGQGELVLTTLKSKANVAVVLPKGAPDKYVVLDANEWRLIAEATADKAREIAIALQPGKYKVKRILPDRLEVGTLVVNAGERADVSKIAFASAPLSAGIVKGDPNTLSPLERHEWTRTEALRLLAEGQAQAALVMFDQLLRADPADLSSWRGRGRAMVRLAEAYQRVGDTMKERRSLGEALRADPSLGEDPMFQIWYQRLAELESRDRKLREEEFRALREKADNPRTDKSFGVGLDVLGGRGLFAVTATKLLKRMVFVTGAVDVATPGLDLSVGIAPMARRWSPFVGVGAHISARELGLDFGEPGMITLNDEMYSNEEIYGRHFRIEAGMQLVSRSGFTTELGLAMILFESAEGKTVPHLWPVFHFGWLW